MYSHLKMAMEISASRRLFLTVKRICLIIYLWSDVVASKLAFGWGFPCTLLSGSFFFFQSVVYPRSNLHARERTGKMQHYQSQIPGSYELFYHVLFENKLPRPKVYCPHLLCTLKQDCPYIDTSGNSPKSDFTFD